jgi:TAT (twin-arginine translocation) pathway signal sequence
MITRRQFLRAGALAGAGFVVSWKALLCDNPWILEATEFNPGQCWLSERSDKSRHEAGNDQRDSPG